jgi:UPF0176 protein
MNEGHEDHCRQRCAHKIRAVNRRILNVAAYRFVALPDAPALREALLVRATDAGLKGTVLLAEEGLNLNLAGAAQPLLDFMAWLQQDARLHGLPMKESWSDTLPYRHLRIKVKREIIRMDSPAIRPSDGRAPSIDATTLARWLLAGHCDEGRPLVMLDARNGFEVDAGAFDGAVDWRLHSFTDFPQAVQAHRDDFLGKTVVSYCTGGIRCEKAALVMQDAGIAHVHQLDGGILGYFAQTEDAPGWHGTCFVFDERVALDSALQPAVQPAAP